jgi:hypothetical protein
MTVNVLLSGRLQLDGYGQDYPRGSDGTYQLDLGDGSTVQDLIGRLGVPCGQVALTMCNARQCPVEASLKTGDRIILIPPDVAAMWRFLGRQNLGAESVFDF